MLDKATLIFAGGGMDSNTAHEYIEQPDCLDIINIRTVSAEDNEQGYAVDIEGTELRLRTDSENESILKGKYFPEINRCIICIHANDGYHKIVEYEPETQEFTTLLWTDALNFQLENKVKDIKLVDKKYVLVNDGVNEIRMFNRDRALNGEYVQALPRDINLIKPQPSEEPKVEYASTGNTNLLKGNLFQFRYQFIYEDGQQSAWSGISERLVPQEESDPSISSNSSINNAIIVDVNAGTKRVKEILVAARIGDGDWFIVDRSERAEILTLSFSQLPNSNTDRAYTLATNTYSFVFRNNGLYEFVDVLETDLLADAVPRSAKALEVINKNVIALGDTFEGYPRPVINAQVTPTVKPIEDPDSGDFGLISYNSYYLGNSLSDNNVRFNLNEPIAGSTVFMSFTGYVANTNSYHTVSGTYTFTSADISAGRTVAYTNMMNWFKANVNNSIININVTNPTGYWEASFQMQSPMSGTRLYIDSASSTNPSISGDLISVPSLKKRSGYQLALAHYDEYGRPFPIVTNKEFEFTTPSSANNTAVSVQWNIEELTAPVGAKTYRWLMSKNTRYENWIATLGNYDTAKSSAGSSVFNITYLLLFSKNNTGSPINYDFTAGDRVEIRVGSVWKDVEIQKVEIEGEEMFLYTGVPDVALVDTAYDLLLYTPRKSTDDEQVNVFYEVGETYEIYAGGDYSVRQGEIVGGDSYIKRRNISDGTTLVAYLIAESPHFSDFYKSDYYSYGRPRTYYDTPEGQLAVARVRHSRELVKGDRIDTNMLSRFYPENYRDYERIHGSIWYLSVRSNSLVVVQEKNTGYVQVQRQIIEDSIGQQNIAVSEELISTTIEYTRGKSTGIGNAVHSFIENYGTVYFIDPAREEVVRVGLDGIISIGYKYSNRLRKLIRETKDTGVESITLYEGMYNSKYNEYMIHFKGTSDPQTYVFSEDLDKWVYRSPLMNPECGFSADNRFYSAVDELFYEHTQEAERATIYGNYLNPQLNFVVNKTQDLVKTFQTMTVQSDKLFTTTENGIKTQLGHTSDLIEEDFEIEYLIEKEGNYRANFVRDNADPINGDRLKGRWLSVNLKAEEKDFKLFKATVVFSPSAPYT